MNDYSCPVIVLCYVIIECKLCISMFCFVFIRFEYGTLSFRMSRSYKYFCSSLLIDKDMKSVFQFYTLSDAYKCRCLSFSFKFKHDISQCNHECHDVIVCG